MAPDHFLQLKFDAFMFRNLDSNPKRRDAAGVGLTIYVEEKGFMAAGDLAPKLTKNPVNPVCLLFSLWIPYNGAASSRRQVW